MTTTANPYPDLPMPAGLEKVSRAIECAPWCEDGDGHPKEFLRADQNCWGTQYKVILGLEHGAPALPIQVISSDAPGLSVYAYREWNGLPHVRLNVLREHEEEHLSVDVDLNLTADEALQLAEHLVATAELVEDRGER
jgi:hypothetical protein